MSYQWYLLPVKEGRPLGEHGLTVNSLMNKRFKENSNALALAYNLLLPFLREFNGRLEKQIKQAQKEEETGEEGEDAKVLIQKDAQEAAQVALESFAQVIAKVTVQTTIGCALIHHGTPLGHSIVHAWDQAPRLHQKYVGNALARIYLPRALAATMGPATLPEDVSFIEHQPVDFAAAFEDSVKRSVLVACGDFVVVCTKTVYTEMKNEEHTMGQKLILIAKKVAVRSAFDTTLVLSKAAAAAVGQKINGGCGEYWGEYVGFGLASAFNITLLTNRKLIGLLPK